MTTDPATTTPAGTVAHRQSGHAAPSVGATARWQLHVAVAGIGIAAAILLRSAVLALLVTPSALLVATALAWRPGPSPRVSLVVRDARLVSDDRTTASVTVTAPVRTVVEVHVPVRGALAPTGPPAATATVGPATPLSLTVPLVAGRWGAASVGPVDVRWHSPAGLVEARALGGGRHPVHVLPRVPAATTLVRPRATHAAHGAQRSGDSGDGTEFADLRPFAPGDRARDVDPWASARRGGPWVVRRHPDRRTDVVLLLDAYDEHQLDDVLAAARSIARAHLRGRDRVGVTTMTGVLRWLPPGEGARHEHRIATALVDARLAHSWVRPAVEELPPRVLPAGALVLGITAGTDPRLADTAVELRRRGWDVAVVVLTPDPHAGTTARPARGGDAMPAGATDGRRHRSDTGTALPDAVEEAARRLVALERRAVRDRLVARGVPTVGWDPTTPVDTALVRLRTWRRRAVHR